MASAVGSDSNGRPEHHRLSNRDYTVGWICALTKESVAAQAFLDERHAPLAADNNNYELGRIGVHNVVITVLPCGQPGTVTAAITACELVRDFPNIRVGLMVGIGGGVPSSRHDIRLGDVVISKPENGHSGVLQYDFGKSLQDQPFKTTGSLAPPPSILLAACTGLQATHESEGHTIHNDIEARLLANERLRKGYSRPDAATDRLYRSSVVHPESDTSSEISCQCSCGIDENSMIIRPLRSINEDNPAVHYGLIGSSNQVMKDAKLRDQYAAKKDILCFEMEAAGVMNNFPCLVIRGISDYADSHKNDEWQGYAAMAAAAYAKKLLSRIWKTRVDEAEPTIHTVLKSCKFFKSQLYP
ncbi:hypothetical protein NQ176_g2447 [Zarea fungicola]|uniref:Uncharacterized protein n=1 Tax=Zarea fungicola TaxID=93591 RepID=A0ACC1NNA5_9HYPO|nr:hypothetical protein NQ176_g2447 [Lecanicillium fungicola]